MLAGKLSTIGPMPRIRLDLATAVLATAAVIGALALVGIFIVYLTDDDNDGKQTTTSSSASTIPTTPTNTSTTGSTPTTPGSATGANPSTGGSAGSNGLGAAAGRPQGIVALNKIRPDQDYATYTNRKAGFSMQYPKGWKSYKAPALTVGWRSNADVINVYVQAGSLPTLKTVRTALLKDLGGTGTIGPGPPRFTRVGGQRAITVRFSKQPPGGQKTVSHRYVLAQGDKHYVVDFANPAAVDNRRAYKQMISSFRFL